MSFWNPFSWFDSTPTPSSSGSGTTGGVDQTLVDGILSGLHLRSSPTSASSTLGQSQYNFSRRTFPADLGSNSYNGHYMVINISVQNRSNMKSVNGSQLSTVLPGETSKVDSLKYSIDNKFFGENQTSSLAQSHLTTLARNTTRIAESIAIYMPNSELTFTDVHDYDNVSLTAFGAMAAGNIAKFAAPLIGSGLGALFGRRGAVIGAQGGAVAGQLLNSAGQSVGAISQINGTPLNPKIEVLYANTAQREFTFEFLMAPTSEAESRNVQEIIRLLRFHAAPELMGADAASSLFYIPPSEFDITFYNRGQENMAIPRINTCALTQVDVSYAPTGVWSTFRNGYPVQVRMMLRFRETEVVHKLRVLQGF